VVGRGVIDDDDFESDARLGDERFQTKRKAGFLIPRRNNYGDNGITILGHPTLSSLSFRMASAMCISVQLQIPQV
jgi:hypothetical protein